jgi:hypothetical protein
MVTGTGPPDVLELWDWTLHSGEAHSSEPHSREQLLVICGQLLLTVGYTQQTLGLPPPHLCRRPEQEIGSHRTGCYQ